MSTAPRREHAELDILTLPTLVGGVRIDLRKHQPTDQWDGPIVALWVAGVPAVMIWQQGDEPVRVDVLGTDPGVFNQLPTDVQAAAAFWEAELPGVLGRWRQHLAATRERDAA